ncbi:MAG: efflux RND transporter permease subunit [Chloracidobacterium sp.]|nr:efflux RND transporter permease subunit [Chloracidobacterium sp.]MDW8217611.1 efflux RND transporter permease subunit [Acidobacteriota bacterium]
MGAESENLMSRIVRFFIQSKLTPLAVVAAVLVGLGAVVMLPREEEPQIVVPMVDVMSRLPGASAKETERRLTTPLERLAWAIPGVEYVYSTTTPGETLVVVRFFVGVDEEDALVRLRKQLDAHVGDLPPEATPPQVIARSIDDVPILTLTFWSAVQDDLALRRIAAEVETVVKRTPDVSETEIIGGARRQFRVVLDPARMEAYGVTADALAARLAAANQALSPAEAARADSATVIVATGAVESAEALGDIVVGGRGDQLIRLRDVADIRDGAEELTRFVRHAARDEKTGQPTGEHPAVTLAVSKRKGVNATRLADEILTRVNALKGSVIPSDVEMTVTRNYGVTAAEKSNELLFHMFIAVVSVMALIGLMLGWRESLIVGVAIPVTLALTLATFYWLGFTLNRITLFALIFSIGILVDDPIVDVENIVRHVRMARNQGRSALEITIEAVNEVRSPLILATLAVMAAILPMAFVGGLMGPYMRPIPIGASAAMAFSMVVAFVVTPWAAYRILSQGGRSGGHGEGEPEDFLTRLYRRVMHHVIGETKWRRLFLGGMIALLLGALLLVPLKAVIVKMLPFDDKSEFQVIVDMPEGATLERTGALARELADYLLMQPNVENVQSYVGTAAPYNFNGLVRHYFLRRGPLVADLQVNLTDRHARSAKSHDIAKAVRPGLMAIAERYGARIKVAEVPPGPPVLSTLVAEIYGPDDAERERIAREVRTIFEKTEGVVDVDWYGVEPQPQTTFRLDRERLAGHGVAEAAVLNTLDWALNKRVVGLAHLPTEREPTAIVLEAPRAFRADPEALASLRVSAAKGGAVAIGELVRRESGVAERPLYHKNLMPVVYVTGDTGGRTESPVYAILKLNAALDALKLPDGTALTRYVAQLPESDARYAMKWDGEWHITYEVFRDLGLAFVVVLLLIYVLTVGWFESFVTPLVIMAAIPFSLVGILPAHAAFGVFFTATSMIGFIAGAGIVVRNSIILVDFIELRLAEGMPLEKAVVDAGAVRFRPMVLTAAAVMVGAGIILLDPIFQGLALALISGEAASLLLSRLAVPTLYYMVHRPRLATPVTPSVETGDAVEPVPAESVVGT